MNAVYHAAESDKEALRTPRGPVLEGNELIKHLEAEAYSRLICVGDRVSHDVAQSDLDADIAIVDGKIERSPVPDDNQSDPGDAYSLTARNPAGVITEAAWNTVRAAVARTCPVHLTVSGEEDLLALPAILFADPDARIVYGQRNEGAVVLTPDAELKEFVCDLLGIRRFNHVIVGGSWDVFHAGHRYLLLTAFEHGKQVDIGITSDEMIAEKLDRETDSFATRKQHIEQFLDRYGLTDRARILTINDIYGNALEEGDVLLVTEDTLPNAKEVNQERVNQGTEPLKLAVIERIQGESGAPISATRVRNQEIDENGFSN